MKDLKVLTGNGLYPKKPGDSGTETVLVVRNKEDNGRRLGIFTRTGQAIAGQQLNHADFLHTPKEVGAIPAGYFSGVEVNLSAKRNYYKIFDIPQNQTPPQEMRGFETERFRDLDAPLEVVSSHVPDLERLRTTLETGTFETGMLTRPRSINSFVSFSIVFAGREYHIGLDIAKHPAHITADLNHRLNRIHPNLRGFVNMATLDGETSDTNMELYITPPDGLDVIFPITTFPVKTDLSTEEYGEPVIHTWHLNTRLQNAIVVNKESGIQPTASTLTHVDGNLTSVTTQGYLDAAVEINLATFEEVEPGRFRGLVAIPGQTFREWSKDARLNMAVVKLKRPYTTGKVFRLMRVDYVEADGNPIGFDRTGADLFVFPTVDEDGLPTVPSVFINELSENNDGEFDGYVADQANIIPFAEAGGLNEPDVAAYFAVFPRPNGDGRNSIFFRSTTASTYLMIEYSLEDIEPRPAVKMDDFGRLDFHRIKTEDHGFLPVSFTAKPITGWGLEFVVDGQEERYLAHKLEHDEETNSTHMLTHGTVGEAVILSDLDYSQVLAPTVDIPFYHLYDEIGAQTWLNFNLLPTGVVTSTATLSEKARFEVVFPRTEMVTTIENITQTLIAGHVEGEVLLKGKMANASYTIQSHVHALTSDWSFTINGTTVTPTRAVDFNKSTGEWSVPIAIADLVASGPGDYTLRVSLAAEYPWLASPEVYSAPLLFVVMSSVQGVEDDVTFIGTSIFDKTVDGSETSGYRLVDLDSGEILATGENVFALQDDATTRGLIDIDLIYGQPAPLPISCEGSPSSVDLEITGEWDLEIEGEIVGSGTMETLLAPAALNGVEIILPPPPPPPVPMSFRIAAPSGIATLDFNAISTEPGTEVVVDWGDGSPVETWTPSVQFKPYHEYPRYTSCIATVTINQPLAKMYLSGSAVTEIIDFGNVAVTDRKFNFSQLTKVPAALPSYVTKMNYMFGNCLKLNDPAISNWDVSNVTEMDGTFEGCKLFNQPLNWHVGNVVLMRYFLSDCLAFNQDLSGWCVPNILTKPNGFDSGATKYALPRPVWGTCPNGI